MEAEIMAILEERKRDKPTGKYRYYKDYTKDQRRVIREIINCKNFVVSSRGPRLGMCRKFDLPIYDTSLCHICPYAEPIK